MPSTPTQWAWSVSQAAVSPATLAETLMRCASDAHGMSMRPSHDEDRVEDDGEQDGADDAGHDLGGEIRAGSHR